MGSVTDRPQRMASAVRRRTADQWDFRIDRGPDWLFLKLPPDAGTEPDLADRLWGVLTRHFTYRLVLEMDDLDVLPSQLMGQLIMLQKRVIQHDGALRLCGLSDACRDALRLCRLDRALPSHANRKDAVRGRSQTVVPK